MKDSVCVGLTMKSIDYFQHGLPIINNIPADTAAIVEKYGVGVNISKDMSKEHLNSKINTFIDEKINRGNNQTKHLFEEMFSIQSFKKKLEKVIT